MQIDFAAYEAHIDADGFGPGTSVKMDLISGTTAYPVHTQGRSFLENRDLMQIFLHKDLQEQRIIFQIRPDQVFRIGDRLKPNDVQAFIDAKFAEIRS